MKLFALFTAFLLTAVTSIEGHVEWLSEENQWMPPGEGDVRGPCPFINTLANHGLIHRDGKNIDLFKMTQIISDTFDLSIDFNMIISQQAIDFNLTFVDETGVDRVNLDDLCQHNAQEHDSSLFRQDEFFSPNKFCTTVDDSLLNDFMRINPTSDFVTKEELLDLTYARIVHSRTYNPAFLLSEAAQLSIAAQAMTMLFLSNDPQLDFVQKDRVFDIMLSERIPDGFVPGLISNPGNFVPFFPFGHDTSSLIFPEFVANVANALNVTVNNTVVDDDDDSPSTKGAGDDNDNETNANGDNDDKRSNRHRRGGTSRRLASSNRRLGQHLRG